MKFFKFSIKETTIKNPKILLACKQAFAESLTITLNKRSQNKHTLFSKNNLRFTAGTREEDAILRIKLSVSKPSGSPAGASGSTKS